MAARDGVAAAEDLGALGGDPGAEVAQAPEGGLLAELGRADGDAVEDLLRLGEAGGAGDQRAGAVAGQVEGLGEGVELDDVVAPARVGEEVVRAAVRAQEVAVGLVDDQDRAVLAGDGGELGDERGRVLGAGGVVGGDEHDGADAGGHAGAGGLRVGEHAGAAGQRDRLDAAHVEPHLVIEVPRHRQQHRVAGGGERQHGGAEGLVAAGGDRHLVGADLAAVARAGAPGDLGAQRGQAEDGAVEVGVGLGADHLGHDRAHLLRRRVDGRGLAEVEERPLGREVEAGEPAAGLHHRRGRRGEDERAEWLRHQSSPVH